MNVLSGRSTLVRRAPLLAGAGLAVALALSPAIARGQGSTIMAIYNGEDAKTAGLQLNSWGS
ncbi:MAG TPA: hypothetical protein VKU00_06230, partial [Chthonomonadaceae bacterium]|nr:hypothetical protein [Chthonomonadaceae bacterium]